MRALSVLLCASGLVMAQAADWMEFTSDAGKCSIRFPGKFTSMKTLAVLYAQGGTALYMVDYTPLPKKVDLGNKDLVKKTLDQGSDSTIKRFKECKVLSEKASVFSGFPARDLDLDLPAVGKYRVRLILTPEVFYQVIVAGPNDFVDSKDAQTFRESFKTTQKAGK